MQKKAIEDANMTERINCISGDAGKVISELSGNYDFVYLDGPKGQYLNHLKKIEKNTFRKSCNRCRQCTFQRTCKERGISSASVSHHSCETERILGICKS